MKADIECYKCCIDKAEALLDQHQAPEEMRKLVLEYVGDYLNTVKPDVSAPVLMAEAMHILEQQLGINDAYKVPKEKYNKILLEKEEKIYGEILKEEDQFAEALKFAVTGNYIDFGAMTDVDDSKLNELLKDRAKIVLDAKEAERLKKEFADARRLVYITDNAGEIVLDKIFIRVIKTLYPSLSIDVIVRGVPVLNDATESDARLVGLCEIANVIPNGTNIPGTPLDRIGQEAAAAIEAADFCIAKGQGNFETLRGCGKNIYYLFLCKCELFVKKFGTERFTPILSNEKRIVQYA